MQPLITLSVAIALIVLNFVGASLAEYFSTMVFLDTVGTAMAAMAFGWWQAAVIGVVTNLAIGWLLFPTYRWFWHVNGLCALAWAYITFRFPIVTSSDIHVILYILAVGALVGLLSAGCSV
jgi:energy-coupling factor transport system substrate-specific component